jgi:hypothetical protein
MDAEFADHALAQDEVAEGLRSPVCTMAKAALHPFVEREALDRLALCGRGQQLGLQQHPSPRAAAR